MKTFLLVGALCVSAFASSAQAQIVADFELNGSTTNAIANGVTLTNNGGLLGTNGIRFDLNQGPSISGLGALSSYTIDVGFTLDQINGPRENGYVKLIDFSGLTSDAGYYSYFGKLNAYPLTDSTDAVFAAGTFVRLTLSRDNSGLITSYIDGVSIYSQPDPDNNSATAITSLFPVQFFTDDTTTQQGEASSGFVDYIRIANGALTPGEIVPVTPAGAVPEPATWLMMIVGFGVIAFSLRRQAKRPERVTHA